MNVILFGVAAFFSVSFHVSLRAISEGLYLLMDILDSRAAPSLPAIER